MADALGLDAVRRALVEDAARADVTTRLLGARADVRVSGRFVAERDCTVAGLPVAALVFSELEPGAAFQPSLKDGDPAPAGDV
ncbi:MAG: carboxylating nicotinate-nucleotide diphosphorylase, partial [Gemmatimonadales bacterium]